MIKLYQAKTVADNFRGHDGVEIFWCVSHREEPVAPYEELIKDYSPPLPWEPGEKDETEGFVDELLTGVEVEELREYLDRQHGEDLLVEEVELPVEKGFLPLQMLQPTDWENFLELHQEKGYSLSIPIEGYYNLERALPSIALAPKSRMAGQEFLERALKKLGLTPESELLATLVEAIYDEAGLYVQEGKPREERLRARESLLLDLPEHGLDSLPL